MNYFTSALESHQRSLEIRRKLFGENYEGTSDNYCSLGIIQYEMGDFTLALRSHPYALDIRLKLFGEDHASTADCQYSMGNTRVRWMITPQLYSLTISVENGLGKYIQKLL